MIPDSFPIPGTHLHLDLAFAKEPVSTERTDLQMPLSISLQSDLFDYNETNLANFTSIKYDPKYFMQAAISQYFIDNLMFQLHKNGLLVIDTGDLLDGYLTVGLIYAAAAGSFWTFSGFDLNAPCKIVMST